MSYRYEAFGVGKTLVHRNAKCGNAILLAVRGQQPAMPVIGVTGYAPWEAVPHLLAAFQRGLAEEGYVEGKNLAMEVRQTNFNFKPEAFAEAARELVRLNVNVIFASVPEAVAATIKATTSIPIVAVDRVTNPGRRIPVL